MTHLSLFSGIGGIDIAAHWAGFRTVQFVERDPFCQKVLAKNFPGVPIHDDITTFDAGRYAGTTIVSAGFPCQPHSVAGKRKASGDERDLWGETARVLGEARPRWFLGENVPGLLSSESGRFFGRVVNDLAALGYRVGWCVYGASEVGACHRRQRIFIVAYSKCGGCNTAGKRGGLERVYGAGKNDTGPLEESSSREPIVAYSANVFRNGGSTQSKRRVPKPGDGDSPRDATDSAPAERKRTRDPRTGRAGLADNGLNGYRELPSRDWRSWPIKPVVRRNDDELPRFMVRHRVNILKALGNAVVPQQASPILAAIAQHCFNYPTTTEAQDLP